MFNRYYIKNRVRFSVFIITVLMILGVCISVILNASIVHGAAVEKAYFIITVESGDTLWTIADKYSDENTDIRKYIYEISNINELSDSYLTVGQQLLIPA